MGRFFPRKALITMATAILCGLLGSLPAMADQYNADSPHSTTYNNSCDGCHYMVQGNPPAWAAALDTQLDPDDTKYNNLCNSCHNSIIAPAVKTHSSKETSTRYGTWSVECRTCHWTHQQMQVRTYGSAAYVASGNSTLIWVDPNPANKVSTLTKAGANWTADQFNGYYLIPNTGKISYNYKITDTTSDTLTVNARIDLTKATVGDPFAVFYGKNIKSTLPTTNSGNKAVRFFNKTGAKSFADGDATYDGVCEACHTQTDHFRNSGAGPTQNHENFGGQAASNCTTKCHRHSAGFRGFYHTASHFSWDAACLTCHPNTGGAGAVEAVHRDTCTLCHTAGQIPSRNNEIQGSATNGIDGDARLANGVAAAAGGNPDSPAWQVPTCLTCHPVPATYDLSAIHHDSKNSYAVDGNCTQCHASGTIYAGDHRTLVTLAANCADCHTGTAPTDANNVPVSVADNKIHDACLDCHNSDADGTLKAAYGDAQAMPDGGAGSDNGGGSCEACHTAGVLSLGYHGAVNHATMVSSAAGCSGCHTATGSTVDPADNKVHDACSSCHRSDNARLIDPTGNPLLVAMPNGGTNGGHDGGGACTTCHGAYFINHDHGNPAGSYNHHGILSTSSCVACHEATGQDPVLGVHDLNTSGNACFACHSATTGALSVGANGWGDATINSGEGGTCAACHASGSFAADKVDGHVNAATKHNKVSADASCTWCHSVGDWAAIQAIHNVSTNGAGACTTCHNDTDSDVTNAIANGKSVVMGGSNSAITCTSCHKQGGANTVTMHGLTATTVAGSHDKLVSSNHSLGYDCKSCHDTMTTAQTRIERHMLLGGGNNTADCLHCHNPGRYSTDKGLGYTIATNPAATVIVAGRSVVAGSDAAGTNTGQYCESCHTGKGVYKLHGLADDDTVANGVNNPSSTPGMTVVSHNKLGNSVGQAVTYTGKLAGAYGGLKATSYNCGDCHSPTPDTKAISTLVAMQLHTKTNGTGFGNCLTCHTHASVRDEIVSGQSVNSGGNATIYCESCHATANGNGPSGQVMYQYDGIRHHTTRHAQAGDCTYCHADPRPTVTTLATGYAATADTVGTYNSGWCADYSGATAPVPLPKQPACRLCHTNAMSYSVEVFGGSGLHGYNIQGTAAQRDTGLTVWANNYNVTTWPTVSNTSSQSITGATRVTQTQIHRIEPNTGTAKIEAYDLGACFSCHSVQIRHASPIRGQDYNTDTSANNHNPYDVLRYAPGRSIFGNGYDLKGTFTTTENWKDHDREYQWLKSTSGESRGKNWLKDVEGGSNPEAWGTGVAGDTLLQVPGHSSFSNFEALTGIPVNGSKNTDSDIYYFADIAAPATLDNIHITKALYNGITLVVEAYSSIGSGQTVSFTYTNGGCGTTAMSWNGTRYVGTCNTPSGWTEGVDKVTVSNTTTASPLDVDTSLVTGIVAANAVADSQTVSRNNTTPLAVMANDTGTDIFIQSLNTAALNANCSAVINGTNVNLTCGNNWTGATSFAYTIEDSQGGTSTATVSLTVIANASPTLSISQPDGVSDTVAAGASYNITYSLADTDNVVTAAFYYDTNNSGLDGTAISGACATAAEGTNVTCAWNTTGMTPGTYYVYGKVSDGINPQVSTYSAGQITITCANAAILDTWTSIYAGTGATPSGTKAISAGTNTYRLLVVAVQNEYTAGNTTNTWTVSYGGQALTPITSINNGRTNMWLGYLKEAGIDAATNTTVTVNMTGNKDYSRVYAITYDNVNQTAPIASFNGAYNGAGASSVATGNITWAANDQMLYAADSAATGTTHTPPGTYTEDLENLATLGGSVGHRTSTASGGTESITVTHGAGYSSIIGAAIRSKCNNAAPTLSLSQPDGVSDTVTEGASYNITYSLDDADNTVTAAFYYDTDNTGLNGTAISGACATAAEGSGVTCAWNTTGMTPGTYYVYGVVNDGVNPQVSAYSAGTITINCQTAAILNAWSLVYEGTAATPSGTKTIAAGTNANRLLVVTVLNESSALDVTNTWSVTYGGQALTAITSLPTGRTNMWMGYLKEAGIDAATDTTVSVTIGGAKDYSRVYAITFDNVNQTTPIGGSSGTYNSNTGATSIATGNITRLANDHVIYAVDSAATTSGHTPPAAYTEDLQSTTAPLGSSVGHRTTTTSAGTETISVSHAQGRSSIIGADIKSKCN